MCWTGLYSYGTTTLDRLAFQKALDDIAANEARVHRFSLSVLKENFARGVALLADNELHPALPAEAFTVSSSRRRSLWPEPAEPGLPDRRVRWSWPCCRRAIQRCARLTPATLSKLTLDDVKQYYAATVRPDLTTIVVIGDITPGRSARGGRESFRRVEGNRPEAGNDACPPVPLNKASAANVADAAAGAGLGDAVRRA